MENEKKAHAIAKKMAKNKKDLIFAGANSLLNKPTNPKEVQERQMIVLVSRALKISPMGVTLLGGFPYVNNQGRKEKLDEYNKSSQFRYEWVHVAVDDAEKAICKAKVVAFDQESKQFFDLCDWVIGECSPVSMKMGTLKGYQNHMAQTRAENRAFEAAFGVRFRKDLFGGIDKELNHGKVDEEIAQKALNAANTSAEEAIDLKPRVIASDPYQLAIKAIDREDTVPMLTMLRARLNAGAKLTDGKKKELSQMIDDKIAKLAKK